MVPVVLAAMAVGTIIKSYGQIKANQDQAEAERRNAAFYREQAAFAEKSGERKREIYDRESQVLYGDQKGAFAKAGVSTGSSSFFQAQQMLYRQNESFAIKEEADFNVRLAMLRADQSDSTAAALTNPTTNALLIGSNVASTVSSMNFSK